MFPKNFLTTLAHRYELSPEQEEVFLLWFAEGKSDREISEELYVTPDAIRNRKTGIYKKFSIAGRGANKAFRVERIVAAEFQNHKPKAEKPSDSDNLESLVKEVKQKIAADVIDRCGTMRVLDMTQPVALDRTYTDVNILEKLSNRDRVDSDEVLPIGDRKNVHRWMMGKIEERIDGLIAVDKIQKLVVLGKPGAGKTTFMKYLAMSCLGDKFHGELVPIFVTLKVYAEERGQPSLEDYILAESQRRDVSADDMKRLLKQGKALILLDGLDEVKKEDDRRVKQDIDKFSRDWLQNRFAITCRIAAREYQFERFTEVEVADFDDEQIANFVNNWFSEKDPSKAERLLEKLEDNEPVEELARTPLLLTLLCWVFEDKNDLPERQSELYKEGLSFLLKKWDEIRYVDRDIARHFRGEQIYKNLSSEDKLDMLGRIAFQCFTESIYFFRQEDLQRQIKDYICNLPEAFADPDALQIDSEGVLKAIEHHHGLLVERARNIYSFSHLTFQEYFTAREIERERHLEILVQNITNSRWREVFYLTAEMLRQSDNLLRLMKSRIDGMLSSDEKLQAFLEWANKKIGSIQFRHKTIAFISFYAYVEFYDYDFAFDFACDYGQDFIIEDIDRILVQVLYDINLSSVNDNIDLAISLARDIRDDILQKALQALEVKLTDNGEEISQWWENHGENWISELRQVCIDHRNIGHDWQFTEEQVELLEQYYPANLLLVECMNRSNVSKEVREEIESTLLLPVGVIDS